MASLVSNREVSSMLASLLCIELSVWRWSRGVVALFLRRRPKMSFAMESVMSGYSQKMLLKLKVLMHKEQFCDVEIIVQVAPSLFLRLWNIILSCWTNCWLKLRAAIYCVTKWFLPLRRNILKICSGDRITSTSFFLRHYRKILQAFFQREQRRHEQNQPRQQPTLSSNQFIRCCCSDQLHLHR